MHEISWLQRKESIFVDKFNFWLLSLIKHGQQPIKLGGTSAALDNLLFANKLQMLHVCPWPANKCEQLYKINSLSLLKNVVSDQWLNSWSSIKGLCFFTVIWVKYAFQHKITTFHAKIPSRPTSSYLHTLATKTFWLSFCWK